MNLLCGVFAVLVILIFIEKRLVTSFMIFPQSHGFRQNFENVSFTTHILESLKLRSVFSCTSRCQQDLQCMSFTYSQTTSSCTTHSVVFGSTEHATASLSTRYYVVGNTDVCPIDRGYIHFRMLDTCHKFYADNTYRYDNAVELCATDGAHLAKFDRSTEHQLIVDNILASAAYNVCYYTGLHQDGAASTGEWVWQDTTLADNYWQPDWPKRGFGQCANMCASSPLCKFKNNNCDNQKFAVICEIDIFTVY